MRARWLKSHIHQRAESNDKIHRKVSCWKHSQNVLSIKSFQKYEDLQASKGVWKAIYFAFPPYSAAFSKQALPFGNPLCFERVPSRAILPSLWVINYSTWSLIIHWLIISPEDCVVSSPRSAKISKGLDWKE